MLIGTRLVFRDGTPDILAYPRDRKAYGRLCQLLSIGKHRPQKANVSSTSIDLFKRDGLNLIVMPEAAKRRAAQTGFGECWPGHDGLWLAASMLYTGEDRRRLKALQSLARETGAKLIAVNDAIVPRSRATRNCRASSPASASM